MDGVHARRAGRLGVEVGEGAEIGAGDDHVHPHLVGADQVVDEVTGVGVADLDGQIVWAGRGGWSAGASRLDLEAGVAGADRRDVGLFHDAHRGPHRHAHALGPGEHAVHAALGLVGAAEPGEPDPEGEGHHGDRRRGRPSRSTRARSGRWMISCAVPGAVKRRSRSALVTTLTELIAIAALASTGSSRRRATSTGRRRRRG